MGEPRQLITLMSCAWLKLGTVALWSTQNKSMKLHDFEGTK